MIKTSMLLGYSYLSGQFISLGKQIVGYGNSLGSMDSPIVCVLEISISFDDAGYSLAQWYQCPTT